MFEDDVFHKASGEAFKIADRIVTVIHRIWIEKRKKLLSAVLVQMERVGKDQPFIPKPGLHHLSALW